MHETAYYWVKTVLFIVVACRLTAASIETMGEEVSENPVEEALDNGLSDLMKSISTIQNRLRNITSSHLGNYSAVLDTEIKSGMEAITKDITYDNLLEKIKLAKNKIKEIQSRVSSTMSEIENNWPEANITRHGTDNDGERHYDSGETEDDEFPPIMRH